MADDRGIQVVVNPPTKKKPEAHDAIVSLKNAGVLTAVQQSQIESLFKIGNNCAHPKEQVVATDIERLIKEGKQLASIIL